MATMSDEAIQAATGRTRGQWVELLDSLGARTLSHAEIAKKLSADGLIASGWWCQTVTVEYERAIGRRAEGEKAAGEFAASASRSFPAADLDGALEKWTGLADSRSDFDGVAPAGPSETSASDKWRYWRVNLDDGSKIVAAIHTRKPGQATLAISHERLPDADAVTRWKTFWKTLLAELS